MNAHDMLISTDPKVQTAAASSLIGWLITISEQAGPVVDLVAGITAIFAGAMAILWTAIRMYDRWMDRKNRK